jgi:hypothetical protein
VLAREPLDPISDFAAGFGKGEVKATPLCAMSGRAIGRSRRDGGEEAQAHDDNREAIQIKGSPEP